MSRLFSTLFKIILASLVTGAVLTKLNFSVEEIMHEVGLDPSATIEWLQQGAVWAVPNILLGSIVILPVWLLVNLFRPPRG